MFELRPSIQHPRLWRGEQPPKQIWDKLREEVLDRDDFTCRWCGHRALKYMHVHHRYGGFDHSPEKLATCCVACHAVMHIGRSLLYGTVEIWLCSLNQVEIVIRTRSLVQQGWTLAEINSSLKLKAGPLPANAIQYADRLVDIAKRNPAYFTTYNLALPKPLCAVFIDLKKWQIEAHESCDAVEPNPARRRFPAGMTSTRIRT